MAKTVVLRSATAEEAAKVADLIRECYGPTHPNETFYDPEALRAEMERGDAVYAVVAEGRRFVAQAALTRAGASGLYECTRAMVSVAHRDRGHFGALASMLIGEVAPAIGARFVLARAVTNHVFAQRFARANGGVAAGVLLGMIPETLSVAGFGRAATPVSAIVHLHRIERAPRTRRLALRGRDLERASGILARLGVPVEKRGARERTARPLRFELARDPSFGVAHLRFGESGTERLGALLGDDLGSGARLIWADVPVESPGVMATIDALREAGLGFGAYLPLAGPGGEDVLRFQLVVDPAVRDALAIEALDENRALVDEVLDEARGATVLAP